MNTPKIGTVSKVLVSRREASIMLSLSQRSIGFLIKDGRLPSIRVGRRSLVRAADLHAFAEAGSTAAIRPTRRS
jgi:excisionase family DNA binding protein